MLRPASASAAATSSRQASTHRQRDLRGRAGGRWRADRPERRLARRSRAAASSRPRSRRRPRHPRRRGTGTGRPATARSRRPRRGGPRAGRTWADPRTVPRPSPRGWPRGEAPTAEALPPPGTGAADPSAADESVEREVAEARADRLVHHVDCTVAARVQWRAVGVGARAVPAPPLRDPTLWTDRRWEVRGRSGRRRARTPVLRRRCCGQAARRRTSSSRPVTVQRRERCW